MKVYNHKDDHRRAGIVCNNVRKLKKTQLNIMGSNVLMKESFINNSDSLLVITCILGLKKLLQLGEKKEGICVSEAANAFCQLYM